MEGKGNSMNVERIKDVIRRVRELPPERLDMGQYSRERLSSLAHDCQSAGCVAGWCHTWYPEHFAQVRWTVPAYIVPGTERLIDGVDGLRAFLDLPLSAWEIFHEEGTPSVVADRLERYMDTHLADSTCVFGNVTHDVYWYIRGRQL